VSKANDAKISEYFDVLLKGSEILKGKSDSQEDHRTQVERVTERGECAELLEDDRSNDTLEVMSLSEAFGKVQSTYSLQTLNAEMRAVLDWYVAHLEYGCGSGLDKVSMMHWDQDEDEGMTFSGDHVMMQEGYINLLNQMATDLEIRFNREVRKIVHMDRSVKIITHLGHEFEADCCICTIPLGVLQKGTVEFVPSLPPKRMTSLNNLGAGNLNKSVLIFDNKFWGDEDYFGFCNQTECIDNTSDTSMFAQDASRGRWFYFWNLHNVMKQPVLVALSSGPAADKVEDSSKEEVKIGVLNVLEKIFGEVVRTTKLIKI